MYYVNEEVDGGLFLPPIYLKTVERINNAGNGDRFYRKELGIVGKVLLTHFGIRNK